MYLKKKALDFGRGFYLTSDYAQATRWAKTKAERYSSGNASVSIYEFDEEYANMLKVLLFNKPKSPLANKAAISIANIGIIRLKRKSELRLPALIQTLNSVN